MPTPDPNAKPNPLPAWRRIASPSSLPSWLGRLGGLFLGLGVLFCLGVFFWFILPIGPAGAVLYRLSDYVAGKWNHADSEASPALQSFAQKAFDLLDWAPARLTASGYAIVGNFEDAVDIWRGYSQLWANRNTGVMLASAAGAVGIRLGATAAASPAAPTEPGWTQEGENGDLGMSGLAAAMPGATTARLVVWV